MSSQIQSIGSINTLPCLLIAHFELCGIVIPVVVDTGATISCVPEKGMLMKTQNLKVKPANLNVVMADNFVIKKCSDSV